MRERICVACKTTFSSIDNRKIYCCRECYDNYRHSLKPTVKCNYCGKEIKKRPRDIKEHNFCSIKCRGLFQRRGITGYCDYCGKPLTRPKLYINRSKRSFCGVKCRKDYYKINGSPLKKDKIVKYCLICSKEYNVVPALHNQKYCSMDCKNIAHSHKMSKRGNPNWQGGIANDEYAEEWCRSLKLKVLKRDEFKCAKCGKVKNNEQYDVHHISKDKKDCSMENLITLCHKCHMKYHGSTQGIRYMDYSPEQWKLSFLKWIKI